MDRLAATCAQLGSRSSIPALCSLWAWCLAPSPGTHKLLEGSPGRSRRVLAQVCTSIAGAGSAAGVSSITLLLRVRRREQATPGARAMVRRLLAGRLLLGLLDQLTGAVLAAVVLVCD